MTGCSTQLYVLELICGPQDFNPGLLCFFYFCGMFQKPWLVLCLLMTALQLQAQISPPGLDDTNAAFWTAFGLTQELTPMWTVTVYAGEARQSSPDNYRLLSKQAIFVLNQETQFNFNKFWAASFCTSYRVQSRYADISPFEADDPASKNELRFYGRLYARPTIGRAQLAISFRPEYRTYHYNGEVWTPIDKEIRLRLKGQVSIPLNTDKSNQFIVADEVLSATEHFETSTVDIWTSFGYTESRLSTYYRHVFKHPSIVTDVGVMQQFRVNGPYIVHLAFDVIFVNPFGSGHHTGP